METRPDESVIALGAEFARSTTQQLKKATEDAKCAREGNDTLMLVDALQRQAELLVFRGNLTQARRAIEDATSLARAVEERPDDFYNSRAFRRYGDAALLPSWSGFTGHLEYFRSSDVSICYALHAWITWLLGDVVESRVDFAMISKREPGCLSDSSDYLILSRTATLILIGAESTFPPALLEEWRTVLARGYSILGMYARVPGGLRESEKGIARAEAVLREHAQWFDVAQLRVAMGFAALLGGDLTSAEAMAEEAFNISESGEMQTVQADALVLRGSIRLERGDTSRAILNAASALSLARQCGYVWAQRDALILLASVRERLANVDSANTAWHQDEARAHRDRGESIAQKLRIGKAEQRQIVADVARKGGPLKVIKNRYSI